MSGPSHPYAGLVAASGLETGSGGSLCPQAWELKNKDTPQDVSESGDSKPDKELTALLIVNKYFTNAL